MLASWLSPKPHPAECHAIGHLPAAACPGLQQADVVPVCPITPILLPLGCRGPSAPPLHLSPRSKQCHRGLSSATRPGLEEVAALAGSGVDAGAVRTCRAVINPFSTLLLSHRAHRIQLDSGLPCGSSDLAFRKQELVIAETTLAWSQPPAASPSCTLLPRPIGWFTLTPEAGPAIRELCLCPPITPHQNHGETIPLYHAGERHPTTRVEPRSPAPHLT